MVAFIFTKLPKGISYRITLPTDRKRSPADAGIEFSKQLTIRQTDKQHLTFIRQTNST